MFIKRMIAGMGLALCLAITANAQEAVQAEALPLSSSPSTEYTPKPLTYAQQMARFQAEQRMMRIQYNKWIAFDPLRPTMNASYMSNGVQRFYIPQRAAIVSAGQMRSWYW